MDQIAPGTSALDVGLCVALLAVIGFASLRFESPYYYGFEVAARHPAARFAAGAAIVALSLRHPLLAGLALIVAFFWIADVHLLSSHRK